MTRCWYYHTDTANLVRSSEFELEGLSAGLCCVWCLDCRDPERARMALRSLVPTSHWRLQSVGFSQPRRPSLDNTVTADEYMPSERRLKPFNTMSPGRGSVWGTSCPFQSRSQFRKLRKCPQKRRIKPTDLGPVVINKPGTESNTDVKKWNL